MDCIDCGSSTICAETRTYHYPGDKHPVQRRLYVCKNELCGASFYYLSQYMTRPKALDAAKFIKKYEDRKKNQLNMFEGEDV